MHKRLNLLLVGMGTLALILIFISLYMRRDSQGIKIGAILPLTGSGASFGESSRNALLLAAEEINAVPAGPRLKLLVEDGMTDPKASVTAFNRLHDMKGTRLFITSVSSVSLALAPLADQKGSLLFANASHPQVIDGRRLVLRYSNTAIDEAHVLINFISQHNSAWSRIYIIALNDDYGRAYVHELIKAGDLHSKLNYIGKEFYDRTTTDFRTLVTKVIASTPDAVILIGFGRSMGICVRQLRELGYRGPFIASLGFILTSDAITAAGEAIRGGYLLNFTFVSELGARNFRNKYRTRYGIDPTPNAVIDYGTLHLLSQGLKEVGREPSKLVLYFRGLGIAHLPTGDVSISAQGDIIAPVYVIPVPSTGVISLWGE